MDWAKAATEPLGLAGFALSLVFGGSCFVKKKMPEWWPSAAITLAALCILGGIWLAGLRLAPSPSAVAGPGGNAIIIIGDNNKVQ